ncbi:MAG: CidA/LrgA family protein, partial [Paucibacter sp.]|nr:CidA/LrgA family protein [Roseateles sp.]
MYGLLTLIACELAGALIGEALHLPIPGPVLGLFLLAALLAWRMRGQTEPIPQDLGRTADFLIQAMGLLFVPAGVGVITEASLLRTEWLPIAAAVVGSTIASLAVTGLVLHRALHARHGR